jgi:hypothetical protein
MPLLSEEVEFSFGATFCEFTIKLHCILIFLDLERFRVRARFRNGVRVRVWAMVIIACTQMQ